MLSWMIAAFALASPEPGRALVAAGDLAGAKAAFEACLAENPAEAACAMELGWLRWSAKDWPGAVRWWRQVAALQPDNPDVKTFLPQAEAQADALARSRAQASTPPPPPKTGTLRIRAVGDIMMGTDFPAGYLPPDAGASAFAAVRPLLVDADLTFGNLEGPLCDTGETTKCGPGENCYAFRTPTAYGRWLVDAGFDLASTANNHAEDFGPVCRLQTEQTLAALGIGASGRPGVTATVTRNGLRVGLIAFHTNPNSHDVNDLAAARVHVQALAATHDLVVVSFHGGAEGRSATHVKAGTEMFLGENRGDLRAFARTVIEAGADLVLGHGPHVPRGLELIDGRLVIYSLGNFSTYGRFNLKEDLATSLVLEATLDGSGRFVAGRLLPVHQGGAGIPAPDPTGRAVTLLRELTAADFPNTGPRIDADGAVWPR